MSNPDLVEVTSNRNFVLTTPLGHAIRFVKNEKQKIPRLLLQHALAAGVVPTAEDDLPGDEAAKLPEAPMGMAREQALRSAIIKLRERNAREDFSASGSPKVAAMEKVLGWRPQAREVEDVLAKLNEEALAAKDS